VSVVEYLDQADLKLEACINRAFGVKEAIFPLQTAEMETIRVRSSAFEDRVREFWGGFRKGAPFSFAGSPDQAYASLDSYYASLTTLETDAKDLNEVEELFELPVSRYSETGQCRVQLRLLKLLWDFKAMVLSTYEAWKGLLWADISTSALEDVNKRMAAELKKLGDANPIVKG